MTKRKRGIVRFPASKKAIATVASIVVAGAVYSMRSGQDDSLFALRHSCPAGSPNCDPESNSFTPETPVVMGDGSSKPLSDVRAGDWVMASDLESGHSTPQRVLGKIVGSGMKELVEIKLGTGVLTATTNHAIRLAHGSWRTAGRLRPGDALQDARGTGIPVLAVTKSDRVAVVENLQVNKMGGFYVRVDGNIIVVADSE
ncbi:Hint domain-containing protein [Streptomyces sp. NPDC005500]|uniref:Hint domain-containing protein n=1 Tax=Streptomyces sp. NPDC005500 TaxID=3155007 RepID=UPI0033BA7289